MKIKLSEEKFGIEGMEIEVSREREIDSREKKMGKRRRNFGEGKEKERGRAENEEELNSIKLPNPSGRGVTGEKSKT